MAACLFPATLLFVLATALAASVAPFATPGHAQEMEVRERPPPRVTVAEARTKEVVADVTVTGTLVARKEVLVTPQVEGLRVTSLFAYVGDQVASGQVLAKLDRASVETELAQA